jgi:cytochrome c oxidase assembly protein subunit 11
MKPLSPQNRRMLGKLVVITLGMFGFGFALVPFYDKICEVTGINAGAEQVLAQNTQIDRSRSILLQLDANAGQGMPWRFKPLVHELRIHPGELVQVEYEIQNLTGQSVVGQAIPSYGPQLAALHVKKIECFCFRPQVLGPYETRRLPVLFVMDDSLPADVNTVTLSYTFFREAKPRG